MPSVPGQIETIKRVLRMSQDDIAAACGVSRNAVVGWVGGSQPRSKKLAKLQTLYQRALAAERGDIEDWREVRNRLAGMVAGAGPGAIEQLRERGLYQQVMVVIAQAAMNEFAPSDHQAAGVQAARTVAGEAPQSGPQGTGRQTGQQSGQGAGGAA